MNPLAIELNDAELRVATRDGVVGVEPGCALLDDTALVTGEPAYRSSRLKPNQVYDRFWSELSDQPLPRPHPQARSFADLAFAQLSSLWGRFGCCSPSAGAARRSEPPRGYP